MADSSNGKDASPNGSRPSSKFRSRRSQTEQNMKKAPRLASSLAPGETIKDKQQRAREEREAKRSMLDGRHETLLGTVATSLGLDFNDVIDFVLEGNQIEQMEEFFNPDGRVQLMFYYQEVDSSSTLPKSPKVGMGSESKHFAPRVLKPRLFVTDGSHESLSGFCLYFIKSSKSKAITTSNIHTDVNFGIIDAKNNSIICAIKSVLSDLYIPVVSQSSNWGDLSGKESLTSRTKFLSSLETFVEVLSGAQDSLEEAVTLEECTTIDLSKFYSPSTYSIATSSTEMLETIEAQALVWIKQIEQVLAESEQMRREADNVGPKAELDHWKKRMAKFNSLMDQIKSTDCKTVTGILVAAKSKIIKAWRELDKKITDFANEAKDNVKFLYTLEKFCEPLYNNDPVSMLDGIPGLLNAIRMIHSYSRYYNTSERMTAIFVKVTNQMITACKSYITEHNTRIIWDLDQGEAIKRFEDCLRLNEEYQKHFQRTKKEN